jgi:hypothetical protein
MRDPNPPVNPPGISRHISVYPGATPPLFRCNTLATTNPRIMITLKPEDLEALDALVKLLGSPDRGDLVRKLIRAYAKSKKVYPETKG